MKLNLGLTWIWHNYRKAAACDILWATSHTRVRARDHYTTTTLIGGEGGAGPILLHTTLEGPMQDICKVYVDSYMASNGSCVHGRLDCSQKSSLGGRPNTKPRNHGTPNAHNCWFILLYHTWGSAWIETHWTSIWLRAWSHMASHYSWGSVTTLHDVGGVLGRPLDTFCWALTIPWSWRLACVRSGPLFPVHILLWILILICAEAHRPLLSFGSNWHTQTWKMRCPCLRHCFWDSTVLCYPFWILTETPSPCANQDSRHSVGSHTHYDLVVVDGLMKWSNRDAMVDLYCSAVHVLRV